MKRPLDWTLACWAVLDARAIFRVWLGIGLCWLLLGMQVLPTNKLYHQGLIAFAWLPGLLALLIVPEVRRNWDRPLLALLMLFATWTALSVFWGGDAGRLKVILYVFLAANAWVALASLDSRLLWRLVAMSALLTGLLSWAALISFYGWHARPLGDRVVALGHLDHTILASQVIGASGLLLLFLREYLPARMRTWMWLVACLGIVVFLLMSKSKGPLLAFGGALAFACVCRPCRRTLLLLCCGISVAALAVWLMPEVLLRGGLSYRPQLLQAGYQQFLNHPWLGLGVGADYQLPVAELKTSFEHAHNLYMHIAIRFGSIGLALWLSLQLAVFLRILAWRDSANGLALCVLYGFSALALFTDGIGPWVKPREEWFVVWLPLFICLAMTAGLAGSARKPVGTYLEEDSL